MRSAFTAFERMPCAPRSTAYCRMSATSALLATAYGPKPGPRVERGLARVEEEAPAAPLRLHHVRRAARDPRVRQAVELDRVAQRRLSGRRLERPSGAVPAFDTTTSTPPHAATVRATAAATCVLLRTSATTMSTRSLRPLATFSTAVTSASKSRSTMATCAPAAEEPLHRRQPDAARRPGHERHAARERRRRRRLDLRLLEAPVLHVEEVAARARARTSPPRPRAVITSIVCS